MKLCAESRCAVWVPEGHCYYHRKLKAGMLSIGLVETERRMAGYDESVRDYVRRYPDPVESRRARHHVLESAVLDDEQRELSSVLATLGVDNARIRAAISRQPVILPESVGFDSTRRSA